MKFAPWAFVVPFPCISKLIQTVSATRRPRCLSRLAIHLAHSEVLACQEETLREKGRESKLCLLASRMRRNVRWKTVVGHSTVTCTVKERATQRAHRAGRESVARAYSHFLRRLPVLPFASLRVFRIFALLRSPAKDINRTAVRAGRRACEWARASHKSRKKRSWLSLYALYIILQILSRVVIFSSILHYMCA